MFLGRDRKDEQAGCNVPAELMGGMSPHERRRAESYERMAQEVVTTVRTSMAIKLAVVAMRSMIFKRLDAEGMTIEHLRIVLKLSSDRVIEEVLKILQNGKNGMS